jgi:hypothetical protein
LLDFDDTTTRYGVIDEKEIEEIYSISLTHGLNFDDLESVCLLRNIEGTYLSNKLNHNNILTILNSLYNMNIIIVGLTRQPYHIAKETSNFISFRTLTRPLKTLSAYYGGASSKYKLYLELRKSLPNIEFKGIFFDDNLSELSVFETEEIVCINSQEVSWNQLHNLFISMIKEP